MKKILIVDDEQDIIDYINNVEYQDVVEIIEKAIIL